MNRSLCAAALFALAWVSSYTVAAAVPRGADAAATSFSFTFGPAAADHSSSTPVAPDAHFTPEKGYGFVEGTVTADGPAVMSEHPFAFSLAVPEGNYDVTLVLGGQSAAADTTVKAEARRLMLDHVRTAAGESAARTFTVNVRRPEIGSTGQRVKLKPDEHGSRDWDDQLTIEFLGSHPAVRSIAVNRNDAAVTLFVAGDSTVCDQNKEPYCGWAQMLPSFFKEGLAVSNEAESGESLRSSLGARRLDKILDRMKPGDYLFIQYGHNDQKDKSPGAGAFTTYRDRLKQFVDAARKKGGLPVLVTSMNRRTFGPDGKIHNSLGDFPEAVRQVAREENVPLIDLHAMSAKFYEAMGPTESTKAFVQYPANTFPGQPKDNTHFNSYGAYELARCMAEGIKADHLPITRFLRDDAAAATFDPSHPDAIDALHIPPSPLVPLTVPEGH
jgi:lysophospholipase L1-like esterase